MRKIFTLIKGVHGHKKLLSFLALLIREISSQFVPVQGGGMEIIMKTKLRLIAFAIVCFSVIVTSTIFCQAQDGVISAIPNFDVLNNRLIVSGTINSSRGNIPMTMMIKFDDEVVFCSETVSGNSLNSASGFMFEGFEFNQDATSGTYDIYVSSDFLLTMAHCTYEYEGVDIKYNCLDELKDSVTSASEMARVIETYGSVIGINTEEYMAMTKVQKDIIIDMLSKVEVELPENFATTENINKINDEIGKVILIADEAKSVAYACAFTTSNDLDSWLAAYAEQYGFYLDDASTEYDENKISKRLDDVDKSTQMMARIKKLAGDSRSFKETANIIREQAILEIISVKNYYNTIEMVKEFPAYFGIAESNFGKLSSGQLSLICQEMSGTVYKDRLDFGKKFNEKMKSVLNKKTGEGNGGGGGVAGGGGRNEFLGRFDAAAEVVNNTPGNTAVFGDLEGYEWADEAINKLYHKNVINGKGNGIFAPGDLVTRAEFVKMIVVAIGLETDDSDAGFEDVDSTQWYAKYIAASRKAEISQGNGYIFNPDGNITREDIAVMLYRALKYKPEEDEKNIFNDSNDISDYAKSAVYKLYKQGVVNGNGNGNFSPKAYATRAEAAKMIYYAIYK